MAKGTEDKPAVVIIDQSGSNNNVDANITNDSSNPVPVTVQGGQEHQTVLIHFLVQDSSFSGFKHFSYKTIGW